MSNIDMRITKAVSAISLCILVTGCNGIGALEALHPTCTQEQIVVTWQAQITRSGTTSGTLLTHTLTQTNIARAEFDRLRDVLTATNPAGKSNITWTVSAFNVNGGYISFSHTAPMETGVSQPVTTAFSGGGWGALPTSATIPPAVSVRADNFNATSASGSITAITGSPLRLGIDVTTANAAGETIRMTGEAGFAYQSVKALCS